MQRHLNDEQDVLLVTRALIYFVFIGGATVAIAVLAHLLPVSG